MLEVEIYKLGDIQDSLLKFAVIVSNYNGKWVYCKHKERNSWEIAGGHIENGETPLEAAKRELREETGAVEFDLEPVCIYSVNRETKTYGLVCYAAIKKLTELSDFEIEKIDFFDDEPENLSYPDIQPILFNKVKEFKGLN